MDTQTIRYFIKAVNSGSINKAAQVLYMNHQNLGKKITQLEDELGIKLLERSKTGISLTEEGKIIYEKFKQIDEIVSDIESHAAANTAKSSPRLSTKLTIYLNSSIFPKKASKAIHKVEEHFPTTEINIKESFYTEALEKIYHEENVFANVIIPKDNYQNIPKDIMIFHKFEYDLIAYIPKNLLKTPNPPKNMPVSSFLKMPIALYSAYDIKQNIIYQELNKYGSPKLKHITSNYVNFCDTMYQKKYATVGWYKDVTKYYESDTFSNFMLNDKEIAIVPLTYKKKPISAYSTWLCRRDTKLTDEVKYFMSVL